MAIIALLALQIMACIAEPDSVTTEPYKVSFDLGLNKSEYNITIYAPETSETLGGIERKDYNLLVLSLNKTKLNESGVNLSQLLASSDKFNLVSNGTIRFAMIGIREFEEAQEKTTAAEIAKYLEESDGKEPQISGFQVATRNIDGTSGAISSGMLILDPTHIGFIEWYHALYTPVFDPLHLGVEIISYYPWDSGTLQLLKTIHIERIS